MVEKKDYPLRFLEIIAGIIKRRKERGLYFRAVKQKRLEVKPKLSSQKSKSNQDKSLKISNVILKKKKLPKKKNKYLLIPVPKENKASKKKKSSSKNSKTSSLKKSNTKNQSNKKSRSKKGVKKTQNIITLEPYINAQPKKVTLSLNGVKQDSNQSKSDIPIKHPLEKIILNELDNSAKKRKPKTQNKKGTKKSTIPKKSVQNKYSAKKRVSKSKKKDKKSALKSKNSLNPKSSSKKESTKKRLQEKSNLPNKEELLSKIKTLETWMSKVKGTVNDKTIKNLEEKLSSLKSKVSKMK
jgi:hypothetical protein